MLVNNLGWALLSIAALCYVVGGYFLVQNPFQPGKSHLIFYTLGLWTLAIPLVLLALILLGALHG